MTDDDYEMTQELLLSQARIFAQLDLTGFLRRIEHADAICPLIDPTMWIKGHDRMNIIHELAQGALEFQKSIHRAEKMRMDLLEKETRKRSVPGPA